MLSKQTQISRLFPASRSLEEKIQSPVVLLSGNYYSTICDIDRCVLFERRTEMRTCCFALTYTCSVLQAMSMSLQNDKAVFAKKSNNTTQNTDLDKIGWYLEIYKG